MFNFDSVIMKLLNIIFLFIYLFSISCTSKTKEETLYEVLELPKDATDKQIKQKYKKLALEYHPDRGGDEQKFQDINLLKLKN